MPTIEYDDLVDGNHTTPPTVAKSFFQVESIAASVLLLGGIIGILIILVLTVISKRWGLRGVRWYSCNLALCGLINIANDAMFSKSYNFSEQIQRYSFSFYNRVKPYNKKIVQWHYCVYCFTTIFLLIDCMMRARKNKSGFPNFIWFCIVIIADAVPAIYIGLRQEKFNYWYFKVDPINIYHALFLIAVFFLYFLFMIFTLITCCRKNKDDMALQKFGTDQKPAFGKRELIGVFFYGLCTIFMQLTAGMMLGSGFIGLLDKQQQESMMFNTLADHGDIASLPFYVEQWASTSLVFNQVISILLFMPSYACWNRRRNSLSHHGHPSAPFQSFNNDGTTSTIASDRMVIERPATK